MSFPEYQRQIEILSDPALVETAHRVPSPETAATLQDALALIQ